MRKAREGDLEAWEDLIGDTSRLVYGIAFRFGLTPDESEDVCQETYLALFRSLEKIRGEKALPRWLAVTAARNAKRAKTRRQLEQSIDQIEDHPSFQVWERAASKPLLTPEDEIDLADALGKLPSKCQDILRAIFFENLSYAEVSERLQVPVGSLGPTQARCLQKLADHLAIRRPGD